MTNDERRGECCMTAVVSPLLSGPRRLRRESLHAPAGGRFADVEIALRIHAHAVRAQHLSELTAAAAELADDLEIAAPQDPDLVVGAVGHIEPLLIAIRRQHRNERRARGQRARRDDLLLDELALLIEHLDAVAAPIGDVDHPVARTREAVHGGELLVRRPRDRSAFFCVSSGASPYAPQCRRYLPVAPSNTITRRLR